MCTGIYIITPVVLIMNPMSPPYPLSCWWVALPKTESCGSKRLDVRFLEAWMGEQHN